MGEPLGAPQGKSLKAQLRHAPDLHARVWRDIALCNAAGDAEGVRVAYQSACALAEWACAHLLSVPEPDGRTKKQLLKLVVPAKLEHAPRRVDPIQHVAQQRESAVPPTA